MAENTTNYQCPSCTAPLRFDGKTQLLQCDHCNSSFNVAEIEAIYNSDSPHDTPATAPDVWSTATLNSDWGEEGANMHVYNCTSCGAEIICDATTAATSCHYCGNKTIIEGQFAGTLRPDYVIPFKLSKEEAKNALKNHCKDKKFLPNDFIADTHIDEIKGVYVPFWLFDTTVAADISFDSKKSSSHTSGNYRITETAHYKVRRAGTVSFHDIPVDGSTKMPDDYMESIEPFEYSDMVPFSAAYMPGFFADKFDVDAKTCTPRAEQRSTSATLSLFNSSVAEYSSNSITSKNVNLTHGEVRYAMAPVWLLTTRFREKVYLFAMNGQTGKFVGDLPCDKGKRARFILTVGSIATAVAYVGLLIVGPYLVS